MIATIKEVRVSHITHIITVEHNCKTERKYEEKMSRREKDIYFSFERCLELRKTTQIKTGSENCEKIILEISMPATARDDR